MSRSSWFTQSPPGGRGVRQSHRGMRAAASPKKKGMPSEGREGQGWRGQELARTLHAGAMWGHRVCRAGTHVGTHGHAWTQGPGCCREMLKDAELLCTHRGTRTHARRQQQRAHTHTQTPAHVQGHRHRDAVHTDRHTHGEDTALGTSAQGMLGDRSLPVSPQNTALGEPPAPPPPIPGAPLTPHHQCPKQGQPQQQVPHAVPAVPSRRASSLPPPRLARPGGCPATGMDGARCRGGRVPAPDTPPWPPCFRHPRAGRRETGRHSWPRHPTVPPRRPGAGRSRLSGVPLPIIGAGPEDGGIAWGCEVMGRVKKERKNEFYRKIEPFFIEK